MRAERVDRHDRVPAETKIPTKPLKTHKPQIVVEHPPTPAVAPPPAPLPVRQPSAAPQPIRNQQEEDFDPMQNATEEEEEELPDI